MTILFIPGKFDSKHWVTALHQLDPDLSIDIWPDVKDHNAIQFAMVWTYPKGELLKYPNLKGISSLGAGVDHIFNDTERPADVPIVRIVDKNLVRDMSQYVIWAVLNHTRSLDEYRQSQARSLWTPRALKPLPHIGIMGLGQLGSDAAVKLQSLGFSVSGWSNTLKDMPGITCFAGEKQRNAFLNETDILICLLPLTPETRHILNRKTFSQLKKGAYLINVARGGHLLEEDLVAALDNHVLSGACLDVFNTEPLPSTHPFWQHPAIKITPHISSVTDPTSAVNQIFENYRRVMAGEELLNRVDVVRGY
jgi:glyoxylate/hydroxypyruvate reductase A